MARISYKSHDDPGPDDIVRPILERRGGSLLNLDRMLLHSPAYAEGWSMLLGRVRGALEVDPLLRELVTCCVASLTGDGYERHYHGRFFVEAGGRREQLAALSDPEAAVCDEHRFDDTQRAVLRLAVEMTRDGTVGDETFAAAKYAMGDDRSLVEIIAVIATYNMVCRFSSALQVDLE